VPKPRTLSQGAFAEINRARYKEAPVGFAGGALIDQTTLFVVSVALVLGIIVTPGVILIAMRLAILACVGCPPAMPAIVVVPVPVCVTYGHIAEVNRHGGGIRQAGHSQGSADRHDERGIFQSISHIVPCFRYAPSE
jgi:hypothetical protein